MCLRKKSHKLLVCWTPGSGNEDKIILSGIILDKEEKKSLLE